MVNNLWERIERIKTKQKEIYQEKPELNPDNNAQKELECQNAPLPRTLTRISPFYPCSQAVLKHRPYLQNILLADNPWGKLTFTGPMLSIGDEDCLLAILALIDAGKGEDLGDKYAYKGPLLPILKLMGCKASSASYERVKGSIERLKGSIVKITTKNGEWKLRSLLDDAEGNSETVSIACNKFFYEQFKLGQITLLDLITRNKLKAPTSKALYRFILSHRSRYWEGHIKTLSKTINLNLETPLYKIRERLKKTLNELIRAEILTSESKFLSKNIIYLERQYNYLK